MPEHLRNGGEEVGSGVPLLVGNCGCLLSYVAVLDHWLWVILAAPLSTSHIETYLDCYLNCRFFYLTMFFMEAGLW